jgi:hypothetical protein
MFTESPPEAAGGLIGFEEIDNEILELKTPMDSSVG